MFARKALAYKPIALPDRMDLTDQQMLDNALLFYDRMKRRHSVRDYFRSTG